MTITRDECDRDVMNNNIMTVTLSIFLNENVLANVKYVVCAIVGTGNSSNLTYRSEEVYLQGNPPTTLVTNNLPTTATQDYNSQSTTQSVSTTADTLDPDTTSMPPAADSTGDSEPSRPFHIIFHLLSLVLFFIVF